ncbi:predicted protein [Streptomyces viridosporus ATCC 14672]|uniref:Predicted protein n=1 Tax=Streptomyces viridosporus (strain ATCC 14672 / DSM 40746 / JCM 4963 / KCTC 9882 / NRRL B-12104 / FH 1290) TaxID=566461 RepID=D6A2H9_STRV1|nr:predicted protein [Streptomyces viridosporus ATCC 14672]
MRHPVAGHPAHPHTETTDAGQAVTGHGRPAPDHLPEA